MTMKANALRILLIEDNLADTEMTVREMKRGGLAFDWRRVETEADLRRECAEFEPTVVLSDFAMPQFDGLSALRIVRELRPEVIEARGLGVPVVCVPESGLGRPGPRLLEGARGVAAALAGL